MRPSSISLGRLNASQAAQGDWEVHNSTDAIVSVDQIESSCDCVTISPRRFSVEPGSFAKLIINYEPSEYPNFRGVLSVDVDGKSAEGETVFHGIVKVEIVDK